LRLLAQNGRRDQRDEEVNGKRFYEGVEGVDEGVLVELLGVTGSGDFGLDGFGSAGAGLGLLDEPGKVVVHGVAHEVEVDNLPRDDIDDAGDEGDANADGEAPAKGNDATGVVVSVGADAKVHEERDEDDGGVADDHAFTAVFEIFEKGQGGNHQDGGKNAGDKAEGEDGLLQCEAPVE